MSAQHEEVKEWLYFSGEDFETANLLLREKIYSQACFHAQQCVEKALKAYVVYKSGSVIRVHDLNELLEHCYSLGAKKLHKFEESINFLSRFYTLTRYPDAVPGALEDRLPNKVDAAEVVEIATKVHAEIIGIIKI